MRHLLSAAVLVAACHGNDPATGGTGPASSAPATTPSTVATPAPAAGSAAKPEVKPEAPKVTDNGETKVADSGNKPAAAPDAKVPPAGGHDFTAEGKAMYVVGACGEGASPADFPKDLLAKHCDVITKAQTDYTDSWVKPARAFFEAHVPKDIPKTVVYPFAGGDLSTALTVYPDADEITTLSLEPAGDPRDIDVLKGKDLEKALDKVEYELKFLYRVNFSNTMNMIEAMRAGSLPTELIFALSAMKIHGYEIVQLRYFKINDDGTLHYLDDADIAKAGDPLKVKPETRNFVFANAELEFRKPGGRIQVWRHIRANLGDEDSKGIGPGLKKDPRVLKHLELKGDIAAMTKAASYLLSWDSFSLMRGFLLKHVQWMVSDATGVAPKWGKPAGFEYETYGAFVGPHIPAGNSIQKDWRTEFESQDKRELPFRFGYYDKKNQNHLIIMRRKK
ncbi:MAG: hypothetical protein JO257_32345 [Deltaproteobacteria bacterium]|nr:hypothetical protein [Deltaproteobacteria bacterium]